MTRIAVIGGTGYAGRHIVAEAVRRGHTVVSVARSVPAERIEGATYIEGTLLDVPEPRRRAAGRRRHRARRRPRAATWSASCVRAWRSCVAALPAGVRLGVIGGAGGSLAEAEAAAGRGSALVHRGVQARGARGDRHPRGPARDTGSRRTGSTSTRPAASAAGTRGSAPGAYRDGGDVIVTDDDGESYISRRRLRDRRPRRDREARSTRASGSPSATDAAGTRPDRASRRSSSSSACDGGAVGRDDRERHRLGRRAHHGRLVAPVTQHVVDVARERPRRAGRSVPRACDMYQRCSSTWWKTSAGSSFARRSNGIAFTTGSNTRVSHSCAAISSSSPSARDAGAELVEVVEQAPGLVLLDVESGQAQQAALVVPGIDDLRLDRHAGAVGRRLDRHLADVEAEVVEPLDALGDAPATRRTRTTRDR